MREIVINTGPVIALVAATGTLDWLTELYDAIHAQAARETKCVEIYTLNVRHFKLVAPDVTVKGL